MSALRLTKMHSEHEYFSDMPQLGLIQNWDRLSHASKVVRWMLTLLISRYPVPQYDTIWYTIFIVRSKSDTVSLIYAMYHKLKK